MNLRNYSGTLRKSGISGKLLFLAGIIFSGCATVQHTPKTYTEKELNSILSGHRFLPKSTSIKYRIGGKGISISGKALLQQKDSYLLITTHNFFMGEKTLKIHIGNSGYAMLDFALLYLTGKNPLSDFTFLGTDKHNLLSFIRNSDTITVTLKNSRIIYITNRNDNVLLFYNNGKLLMTRGTFQGFSFEGSLTK